MSSIYVLKITGFLHESTRQIRSQCLIVFLFAALFSAPSWSQIQAYRDTKIKGYDIRVASTYHTAQGKKTLQGNGVIVGKCNRHWMRIARDRLSTKKCDLYIITSAHLSQGNELKVSINGTEITTGKRLAYNQADLEIIELINAPEYIRPMAVWHDKAKIFATYYLHMGHEKENTLTNAYEPVLIVGDMFLDDPSRYSGVPTYSGQPPFIVLPHNLVGLPIPFNLDRTPKLGQSYVISDVGISSFSTLITPGMSGSPLFMSNHEGLQYLGGITVQYEKDGDQSYFANYYQIQKLWENFQDGKNEIYINSPTGENYRVVWKHNGQTTYREIINGRTGKIIFSEIHNQSGNAGNGTGTDGGNGTGADGGNGTGTDGGNGTGADGGNGTGTDGGNGTGTDGGNGTGTDGGNGSYNFSTMSVLDKLNLIEMLYSDSLLSSKEKLRTETENHVCRVKKPAPSQVITPYSSLNNQQVLGFDVLDHSSNYLFSIDTNIPNFSWLNTRRDLKIEPILATDSLINYFYRRVSKSSHSSGEGRTQYSSDIVITSESEFNENSIKLVIKDIRTNDSFSLELFKNNTLSINTNEPVMYTQIVYAQSGNSKKWYKIDLTDLFLIDLQEVPQTTDTNRQILFIKSLFENTAQIKIRPDGECRVHRIKMQNELIQGLPYE